MGKVYSWIYIDSINNIWKFYKNVRNEICYKIMYDDEKWTKEKVVDVEVLEAFIYVVDETIHIVYITLKHELKYCTMKEKQWIGRTIYQLDSNFSEMQNIKVEIIGPEMHIFFVATDRFIRNQAVLMQCIWSEADTKTEKLQAVIMDYHLEENYLIEVDKKGNLTMLYATYERDEFGINLCSNKDDSWSQEKRLYSIRGEKIDFKMLVEPQVIHIINKYKENSVFCLDYVSIDKNGTIEGSKVHESNIEITEPILIKYDNIIYAFWLEENKIFYSFFDGEGWNKAIFCNNKGVERIEKYHFYSDYSKGIKEKEVYGASDADYHLFSPFQHVMNVSENQVTEENKVEACETNVPRKKESIQTYKMELIRMKSENRDLSKRLASFDMQLQKKKRTIEEQEESLSRTLVEKQATEEKNNLYLKLHKKAQSDLEQTSQQLLEEQKRRADIESRWKRCEETIAVINQENIKLTQEIELMIKEIEFMTKEKEQLMMEIKEKTNKSFMGKFRKGKDNEIKT